MELSAKKNVALEYLKSQNWYKMYLENWGVGDNSIRGRSSMQFFSEEPVHQWINHSMEWSRTPQGHMYWSEINDGWWWKYRL